RAVAGACHGTPRIPPGNLLHSVEDPRRRSPSVGRDVRRGIEPLLLPRLVVASYADSLPDETDLPLPGFLRGSRGSSAWRDAIEANLAPAPHAAGPDDLAVMPYTSGTTGKPKGCMHTHSSVQATT